VHHSSCFVLVHYVSLCDAAGPEFREHSFFGRMFYILLFAGLQRQKYYFAWKLGIHCNRITQYSCLRAVFIIKIMHLLIYVRH